MELFYQDDIKSVFERANVKVDQKLSKEEFSKICKPVFPEMSDEDLFFLFDRAGSNRGGSLNYKEFIDYLFNSDDNQQGLPRELVELQAQKRAAVGREDFLEAHRIKEEFEKLLAGIEDKKAKPDIVSDLSAIITSQTLLSMPLTVVVFGATGDLAKKKLYPALYQLCMLNHFPRTVNIVGYGRSEVNLQEHIDKQCVNIKEDPRLKKEDFCARIKFHAGGYDAPESYAKLDAGIKEYEAGEPGNRIFFMSVPPTVFGIVAEMIKTNACAVEGAHTRVMIEKPFGQDSQTFSELDTLTAKHFKSTQLFRLDHYLGKEVILNIATLRWGNQIFEPLWNNKYIESVQFTFKEDLGTGGRGGYFDGFGIIRDIIQNHLLQAFMWLAIEMPSSMSAPAIIKCKVDLLSAVKAVMMDSGQVFLAQFGPNAYEKGYLDDETVPNGSRCPTFASICLKVDNARWRGVPFLFTAGKGMDERVCEIRVRFKTVFANSVMGVKANNELVLRVQPDEALYMLTVAKEPGITSEQVNKPVVMDMTYSSQFGGAYVGYAYERMLLNTALGEQSLFVSSEELVEAWRIFTPLLHEIDQKKPQPVLHEFGLLPAGYSEFCLKCGIALRPTWMEYFALHDMEKMKQVFAELDTNGDGALDYKEVTAFAKTFFDGRAPTEAKIKQIFKALDIDKDERLTLDEVMQGAQHMQRNFAKVD